MRVYVKVSLSFQRWFVRSGHRCCWCWLKVTSSRTLSFVLFLWNNRRSISGSGVKVKFEVWGNCVVFQPGRVCLVKEDQEVDSRNSPKCLPIIPFRPFIMAGVLARLKPLVHFTDFIP